MVESSKQLIEENEKMRSRDRSLKLEVKLREEERDIVLEKSMVQTKLIKRLSAEYEEMARHIGRLQYAEQRHGIMEQELKDNAALLDRAVKEISMLEECLQAANYEKNELTNKLLSAEKDTYLLQKVLREAVRSIKEALSVQREPSADEAFTLSRRENLLSNLLQLLNTADLPEFEEREMRLQSLVTTSAVYEIGDLGLVPRSSSTVKVESSEIGTVGSNYISKESMKADSKQLSEIKMAPSGDTVSTMSTIEAAESTSTILSSKTSVSSASSRSVIKIIESATRQSLSKHDVIEEVPKDEGGAEIMEVSQEETEEIEIEQYPIQDAGADEQEVDVGSTDDQQRQEEMEKESLGVTEEEEDLGV